MKHSHLIQVILVLTVLTGCQSYYIPVDSFRSQFTNINESQLVLVKTRGPVGDIAEYPANPIKVIACKDAKGADVELENSPSIETRITTSDGKRTIFYFDRIYVQNDTLIGYQSRFAGLPKRISLDEITVVEVQDGHKNFHYIEKK